MMMNPHLTVWTVNGAATGADISGPEACLKPIVGIGLRFKVEADCTRSNYTWQPWCYAWPETLRYECQAAERTATADRRCGWIFNTGRKDAFRILIELAGPGVGRVLCFRNDQTQSG